MAGARSGAVAIRVAAKGGIPRVYRLSALVEVPDMIRGRLPPVGRVVGLDAEAEFLYVVTGKGEVLAVDLGSARVDTVATAVEHATLGPDGTLFTVDAKRRVVSLSRRVAPLARPLPSRRPAPPPPSGGPRGPAPAATDRSGGGETAGRAPPPPAAAIRLAPRGRWLLARPPVGDSVWVVALPVKRLV